jgi:hypothetical protein
MKQVFDAQVVDYKRLNNSENGNPQYEFTLYKVDETIKLRTAANHMFVYALLPETMVNQWFAFTVTGEKRRAIVNLDKALES